MFSVDAHLKFFTDPLSDTLAKGERIYCNLERVERGRSLGKVVEVEGFTRYDGRGWRVSKDGYHLSGPVVNNANETWHGQTFGFIEAMPGVVLLGKFSGIETETVANLLSVRYSDQRALPGAFSSRVPSVRVDTWFKAASWAEELFPQPDDSDDVVSAKLGLAEQRFKQRLAKTTLLLEGANRNYTQLTDLVEEGDLPEPTYGAVFAGDLLIPNGRAPERAARSVGVQEKLDRITAKVGSMTPSMQYIAARVEVPLRSVYQDGLESIEKLSAYTVGNAVRDVVGDYDAQVSNYVLSPVLRAAS